MGYLNCLFRYAILFYVEIKFTNDIIFELGNALLCMNSYASGIDIPDA